jgi:hypothetical protein
MNLTLWSYPLSEVGDAVARAKTNATQEEASMRVSMSWVWGGKVEAQLGVRASRAFHEVGRIGRKFFPAQPSKHRGLTKGLAWSSQAENEPVLRGEWD